ncbi:MAG: glycosyltransferase family 4 protein [Lentisphaeria bacterium]|nr:glycosyltransferase family 4 protein [Lentisphaeria bacterium]
MKILFVAELEKNPNSGAAGTEYQTIIALRELGYEVDEIWADDIDHKIGHWNLHYLFELPFAYWKAIKTKRWQDYDVIHINQPYAWYAARKLKQHGFQGKIINRSHGWEPKVTLDLKPWRKQYNAPDWRFPRSLIGVPMRFVLENIYPALTVKYSDGVVVSTNSDKKYILERYQCKENKICVIPQAPAQEFTNSSLGSFDISKLKKILYVGQTAFFKGTPIAAQVFSRLLESDPEYEISWVSQECYHQEIRSMLNEKARDKINMIGWVDQEKLKQIYDSHGIFLFTSFYEGFGKVFLEAMARGMIVISSDTGGMSDVILHGKNGFLIPVGDVESFVQHIIGLRELTAAKSIHHEALATAKEYSWNRVAREISQFYRQS